MKNSAKVSRSAKRPDAAQSSSESLEAREFGADMTNIVNNYVKI